MSFSPQIRHLLVTLAILTACAIQLARGYRPLIVFACAATFLLVGNLMVYLSGSKERAMRRRRKREYFAGVALLTTSLSVVPARAQLLGEPPLPAKEKKQKQRAGELEWLWQYSPPPAEGREHELIQDPHFRDFLDQYFKAPQSFWGPHADDPKGRARKSLADTVYDFLAIPGQVIADENRYVTATGSVFHFRTSRGLIFADLNAKDPLVVFAAIDWIRDDRPTTDPNAEYTLWIFPNKPLFAKPLSGSSDDAAHLPSALERSLTRWMRTPLPGSGVVQKITAAILVDPDGTPHQVLVPGGVGTPASEGPALPRRTPPLQLQPRTDKHP